MMTPELVWTLWRREKSYASCYRPHMYISVYSSLVFKLWGLCPNLAKCNCNWCCDHEDTLTGQHTRFNKFLNEHLLKLNYVCYEICSLFQLHQLWWPCSVEWPIIQLYLHNVPNIKVHTFQWQTIPNKYFSSILNYATVFFFYTLPDKLTNHSAIQCCKKNLENPRLGLDWWQ
jgi:hypothetical protein